MELPRSAESHGRITLALDAVYCAILGLAAIVFRRRLGGLVGLPGVAIGALGAAILGWAYVVLGQTVRIDWRRGIKEMVAVNGVAAVLLALGAALHPSRGASALMAFVSLDVISLAVAQALSLMRRDTEPSGARDD